MNNPGEIVITANSKYFIENLRKYTIVIPSNFKLLR
jgi:hypothetical protein